MKLPAISVIMPVYNGEAYLVEAMDSILVQTFTNFEFIIIDDASTDATPTILAEYSRRDMRIRILTNSVNTKIAASLNKGIEAARAPLIARMDSDDWAHPERFARQVAYMHAHPEVAVCGTGMEEYENERVHSWEGCGEALRVRLLFGCCVFHPSVMARRDAMLSMGGYATDMPCAEDYDLWVRMVASGHCLACLPDVLLRYRVHPEIFRTHYKWKMYDTTKRIHLRQLAALNIIPNEAEYDRHLFCMSPYPETSKKLRETQAWLERLNLANSVTRVYYPTVFSDVLLALRTCFVPALFTQNPTQYLRRLLRHIVKSGLRHCGKNTERFVLNAFRSILLSLNNRKTL